MFTTSMPAALHNRPPLNHPPNPVIPGLTRNPFLPLPLLPPFTIAPRPNHPPNVVIPPPCHSGLDPESMFYVSIVLPVTTAHARHQQPEHPVIPGSTRNPFLPLPSRLPFPISTAQSSPVSFPPPHCHSGLDPESIFIPSIPAVLSNLPRRQRCANCHSGLDPESIFAPSIVTALYAYPRRCTHQTVSFLRKQESIFAPSNHSAFSEI